MHYKILPTYEYIVQLKDLRAKLIFFVNSMYSFSNFMFQNNQLKYIFLSFIHKIQTQDLQTPY